ncbi:MAG: VanZ family protein [Eubacterium sp.]|nr:VanZ family protein [Eubacterium sp.]
MLQRLLFQSIFIDMILKKNVKETLAFFLLGHLLKEHWKKCLITGFVLSMIIESSQLLVNLLIGYNFRTFDVNDLIFNTLGTIIGYVFFNECLKLYKKAEREEENERRGSKGQ